MAASNGRSRKGGGGGGQPKGTRTGLSDKVSSVNKQSRVASASRAIRISVAKQAGTKRSGTTGIR